MNSYLPQSFASSGLKWKTPPHKGGKSATFCISKAGATHGNELCSTGRYKGQLAKESSRMRDQSPASLSLPIQCLWKQLPQQELSCRALSSRQPAAPSCDTFLQLIPFTCRSCTCSCRTSCTWTWAFPNSLKGYPLHLMWPSLWRVLHTSILSLCKL